MLKVGRTLDLLSSCFSLQGLYAQHSNPHLSCQPVCLAAQIHRTWTLHFVDVEMGKQIFSVLFLAPPEMPTSWAAERSVQQFPFEHLLNGCKTFFFSVMIFYFSSWETVYPQVTVHCSGLIFPCLYCHDKLHFRMDHHKSCILNIFTKVEKSWTIWNISEILQSLFPLG